VTTDVETLVNETFGFGTILCILYVDPNYSHIQLGKNFDNVWLRSENNIIENIGDFFNNISGDR